MATLSFCYIFLGSTIIGVIFGLLSSLVCVLWNYSHISSGSSTLNFTSTAFWDLCVGPLCLCFLPVGWRTGPQWYCGYPFLRYCDVTLHLQESFWRKSSMFFWEAFLIIAEIDLWFLPNCGVAFWDPYFHVFGSCCVLLWYFFRFWIHHSWCGGYSSKYHLTLQIIILIARAAHVFPLSWLMNLWRQPEDRVTPTYQFFAWFAGTIPIEYVLITMY